MGNFVDPIAIPMLTAVSVDETTSEAVALNNATQHYHKVLFSAIGTGIVLVEVGPAVDYAGTWQPILSCDASVQTFFEITWPGPGAFVRHRIDTVLGGCTVTSTCRRIQAGN
jgi:hypothetical protein